MFVPAGPGVEYLAGSGKDWRVTAMQGVVRIIWLGATGHGSVWLGESGHGLLGRALRGSAGQGMAVSGGAWHGGVWQGKAWITRCVPVMWCFAGHGGLMLGVGYMAWLGGLRFVMALRGDGFVAGQCNALRCLALFGREMRCSAGLGMVFIIGGGRYALQTMRTRTRGKPAAISCEL